MKWYRFLTYNLVILLKILYTFCNITIINHQQFFSRSDCVWGFIIGDLQTNLRSRSNKLFKTNKRLNLSYLIKESKNYIRKSELTTNYFDQSSFVSNFYNDKPENNLGDANISYDDKAWRNKKRNKTSVPIVLRITFNTDIGDIQTKANLARKHLQDRNIVTFKLRMKHLGNTPYKRPFVFDKIIEILNDIASPTGPESVTNNFAMLTLKNKLPINKKSKKSS